MGEEVQMNRLFKGLWKLETRRRMGMRWKWKRRGVSHEVTAASQASRREIQDRNDLLAQQVAKRIISRGA